MPFINAKLDGEMLFVPQLSWESQLPAFPLHLLFMMDIAPNAFQLISFKLKGITLELIHMSFWPRPENSYILIGPVLVEMCPQHHTTLDKCTSH